MGVGGVEVEVGMEYTDHGNAKNDIAMAGPERVCVDEGHRPAFLLGRMDGMRVVLTINQPCKKLFILPWIWAKRVQSQHPQSDPSLSISIAFL